MIQCLFNLYKLYRKIVFNTISPFLCKTLKTQNYIFILNWINFSMEKMFIYYLLNMIGKSYNFDSKLWELAKEKCVGTKCNQFSRRVWFYNAGIWDDLLWQHLQRLSFGMTSASNQKIDRAVRSRDGHKSRWECSTIFQTLQRND